MCGDDPADPDGPLAQALSCRPVSTDTFPGAAPSVTRRYDPTLDRLVSLAECLDARSSEVDFDRSELVRSWLSWSHALSPAPHFPVPPEPTGDAAEAEAKEEDVDEVE